MSTSATLSRSRHFDTPRATTNIGVAKLGEGNRSHEVVIRNVANETEAKTQAENMQSQNGGKYRACRLRANGKIRTILHKK